MGIEIERKFLIDVRAFKQALAEGQDTKLLAVQTLAQAYLSKDPWVRVRIVDGASALITVKSGAPVAMEWEYPIPLKDAQEMYSRVCKGPLSKRRHKVSHGSHVWDVDEFLDLPRTRLGAEHWLAEIELKALDQPFARPSWVVDEVTGDARYSNGVLAQCGFPPPPVRDPAMIAGDDE